MSTHNIELMEHDGLKCMHVIFNANVAEENQGGLKLIPIFLVNLCRE